MKVSKSLITVVLITLILFYIVYLKKGYISMNKIFYVVIILIAVHLMTSFKYKNMEHLTQEETDKAAADAANAAATAAEAKNTAKDAVTITNEAIANIASIYNGEQMIVKDLIVTGSLTSNDVCCANLFSKDRKSYVMLSNAMKTTPGSAIIIENAEFQAGNAKFTGNITAPTATFTNNVATNKINVDNIWAATPTKPISLCNALKTTKGSAIIVDQAQLQVPSSFLHVDGKVTRLRDNGDVTTAK